MRIGDSNHFSKTVNTLFLEIKGVFIHPNYNGNSAYFDIAIVETANVRFSYFVSPICLPRSVYTFTLSDFWLYSISFDYYCLSKQKTKFYSKTFICSIFKTL